MPVSLTDHGAIDAEDEKLPGKRAGKGYTSAGSPGPRQSRRRNTKMKNDALSCPAGYGSRVLESQQP
jgi:hypothetical protein